MKNDVALFFFLILSVLNISSCGQKKDSNIPSTSSPPNAGGPGGGGGDTIDPLKISAAQATATTNAYCQAIQPFYWEIGNSQSVITGGSVGFPQVFSNTSMNIASASKWIWGAYALEKKNGSLTLSEKRGLFMTSGEIGFTLGSCFASNTLSDCLSSSGVSYDSTKLNKFNYDNGPMQYSAVNDFGLGLLSKNQFADELNTVLGINISVTQPMPAGGLNASAQSYRAFLMRILSHDLIISDFLGEDKICTLPVSQGGGCTSASYSPIPVAEDWNYSYGHWVEDDSTVGDGAFSSPGFFGFYPWIDYTKEYYGIISRYKLAGGFWESAQCGRLIRKAFDTKVQQ